LPDGLAAELDAKSWPLPPVFQWLQQQGNIASGELARTFNCGIGMVAVTGPDEVEATTRILEAEGETVRRIGRIIPAGADLPGCMVTNLGAQWPG
jgi:phosphoribosylformylglycinamidine cyclo-ligase